jgi:hypothetical protein
VLQPGPESLSRLSTGAALNHDAEKREAIFGTASCSKPLESITFMALGRSDPTPSWRGGSGIFALRNLSRRAKGEFLERK